MDLIQVIAKLTEMRIAAVLLLIMTGVTFTLIGDVYLKRSGGWDSPRYLALGLLFYLIGCVPVVFVFKMTPFGDVFIAWEALTVTLAIIVGHFVFGESITFSKLAAVGLVIAAVVLMGR
jgi:multidrug transporter EmrE-like cation transporter